MANGELGFDFHAPEALARRKSYGGKPHHTDKSIYRTEFMRDRDRIMYCRSFRRLGGKTQIYRAGGNDHQRNRLTHTLEVAQLSRTIATALGLDCDLAEAIALGHDLGHAPFGHAGEEMLHRIMTPSTDNPIPDTPMSKKRYPKKYKRYVGFKHNIQSVRIITEIDNSYGTDGLDLTNFTLWGIMHHSALSYDTENGECPYKDVLVDVMKHPGRSKPEAWSFEAFVVKQADEIAQWHHDLEDALRGKDMNADDVCETIENALHSHWGQNSHECQTLKYLKDKKHVDQRYLTQISHIVIGTLVELLVETSKANLLALEKKHGLMVGNEEENKAKRKKFFKTQSWKNEEIQKAIGFEKISADRSVQQNVEFKECFRNEIHEKIHHSQNVERMNEKGKYIIKKLFASYYAAPQQLPTGILIMYLLELVNKDCLDDQHKENKLMQDVTASWDMALEQGSGAVRICFNQVWKNPTMEQQIILMRKICDHIAGMTDHFALEEYKNLYG